MFIANGRVVPKEQLMSMEPVRTGSFNWAYMYAADKMGWKLYQGINRTFADKLKCLDFDITYYDQHIFRNIFDIRSNWNAYKNLCRFLKAHPDIEIIHCNTPIGGVIGRICGHQFKKKVLYTAHGFHFYKGAPLVNRTVFKWVEMFLAHYTDVLITINKEDYEAAQNFRLKKGGKVCFIPGVGIDLNGFKIPTLEWRKDKRTDLLKSLHLPIDARLMMVVGDLNDNKNVQTIIKAMSMCPKNCHVLICGTGPLEQNLRALAIQMNVEGQCHFLGFRSDVKTLLMISDLFLMVSKREGLPRSTMEAMAAGLPCVVSKIRGNVDLIDEGEGGYTIEPNDYEAFAKAINKILSDSFLAKRMGVYNKNKITQFSIDKVKEQVIDVFNDLQ